MNERSGETVDTSPVEWGIVCALKLEIAPLLDRCERVRTVTGGSFRFRGGRLHGRKLAVVESGMGAARARRAAHALIDAHAPRWLLSAGFSGGLVDEVRVGDVVVADSLVRADGTNALSLDLHMPADPQHGVYVGKMVMANEIVRKVADKRALHEATGGWAVDMESLAVAEVCRARQVKFMAVRVITDDLSADLPPEILSVFGGKGTIRAGAIAGALWRRPSSALDMWQLRERAHAAATRLAFVLDGILQVLAAAPRIEHEAPPP